MPAWSALLLAALAVPLLAGCVGDAAGQADPPAPGQDGPRRKGRAHDPFERQPETLYFDAFYRLNPEPDARGRDGWGFGQGTHVCDADPTAPLLLPCWGAIFEGPARASHAAGDPARLSVWLQGTAARPVVVEAWLTANGTVVAEGRSQPVSPTPGTLAPGPEGCVLAEVDLTLGADVVGGAALALTVRAPGLFGANCQGGGEDGNRLAIGLPGLPGAAS